MSISSSTAKKILELADKYEDEIIALRRHFHMHPEISWHESGTTDKIAEELGKMGIKVLHRGYNGTDCGLIADIEGGKPGKRAALRADIDALPVLEANCLAFKSQNEGAMHACGHDGHAACLLGAAKILTDMRDEISGTVRLVFQPAEESGDRGGAKYLVQEGAMDGVDAIFGIHLQTAYPVNKVVYRAGPCMASADGWELTVKGKGGHGAAPESAIDPTMAACQFGTAIQTIISREISPKDTAVISMTWMETSTKTLNVIPDSVVLKGAVRALNAGVQDRIEAAMKRIAAGIGETTRCEMDMRYTHFYPVTVNDAALAEVFGETARALYGDDVIQSEPNMGSEDFSFYGAAVPAMYAWLGMNDPAKPETGNPHHSPSFDINEPVLKRGAALNAALAISFLSAN